MSAQGQTVPVFVYGTLLADDGVGNQFGRRVQVRRSAIAWVAGTLYQGTYPYLVLPRVGDAPRKVWGKLFALDQADLATYDAIERIPDLYQRVWTPVALDREERPSTSAWAYVRPVGEGDDPVVPSGQFRDWRDAGLFPLPMRTLL